MFVPNFEKSIPGYTGHRPEKSVPQDNLQNAKVPQKHIPGKYSNKSDSVQATRATFHLSNLKTSMV